jgi:hypothetical protein
MLTGMDLIWVQTASVLGVVGHSLTGPMTYGIPSDMTGPAFHGMLSNCIVKLPQSLVPQIP